EGKTELDFAPIETEDEPKKKPEEEIKEQEVIFEYIMTNAEKKIVEIFKENDNFIVSKTELNDLMKKQGFPLLETERSFDSLRLAGFLVFSNQKPRGWYFKEKR
ncbi:MAG: hypothetical protein ACFFCS_24740, partial [Candidatus Hodarchaeota archaeon]